MMRLKVENCVPVEEFDLLKERSIYYATQKDFLELKKEKMEVFTGIVSEFDDLKKVCAMKDDLNTKI